MKLGILGGGQLGMMLGEAARAVGAEPVFLERDAHCPAARVGEVRVGPFAAAPALEAFADCTAITYEFENIPVALVRTLAERFTVQPNPAALAAGQDRAHEKQLFNRLSIDTVQWAPIDTPRVPVPVPFPALLKTRTLGYDGKGQIPVTNTAELSDAHTQLGGVPCVLEERVSLARELSVLAVRARSGEVRTYPLCQNVHHQGILRHTLAPAAVPPSLADRAYGYATALLEHLDYVGVLALELFETTDGRLLANEMAPRVHNSGHWTIEGAVTSQFENHVRAVLDLPLGDAAPRGHSVMINVIGDPAPFGALEAGGATVHDYGKEPRPGRKLGHATVVKPSAQAAHAWLTAWQQHAAG